MCRGMVCEGFGVWDGNGVWGYDIYGSEASWGRQ
jgi:hypothetical protein